MPLMMLVNLIKSIPNSFKKIKLELLNNPSIIECKSHLKFSQKKLNKYHRFVEWKREEISPIFPYALMTEHQFIIVNDSNFPFSPFGLVHKKEKIECFKPLKQGVWEMTSKVTHYTPVEFGYEIELVSELKIDGELYWTSITTAFKRTKVNYKLKRYPPVGLENGITMEVPKHLGLKYGLLSHNIDPIHISNFTAKLMGHKNAIMHGMWTVARSLSLVHDLKYPFTLEVKFIRPIYIPAQVQFQPTEQGYIVCSADGKAMHLQATLT
jgi:hypothetical protein